MTLDECIAYFEEQSKKHTNLVPYDMDEKYNRNCKQLAEWLKELKAYRSLRFSIGETLVDESKWHISSEKAIEKIRNKMVDFDSEQRR